MKKAVRYLVFGLVMYVIFLVATVPAPWVYGRWLQHHMGNWALYGVQGTVWEGRATLVKSGNLQLENLHWDLHPLSLLWGRLEVALEFKYATAPGALVLGRSFTGTWHIDDMNLELPAER